MKNLLQLIMLLFALMLHSCEQLEQIEEPEACMQLSKYQFQVGETIQINDCSENAYSSFFKIDEDNIDSNKKIYNYTFEDPGQYKVSLVAYNRTLRDEVSEYVTVVPQGVGPINVITKEVTDISSNSAKSGGIIETDEAVELRGVVLGFEDNIDVKNRITDVSAGSGPGPFDITLENLLSDVTYFVKAYALVNGDYYYGKALEFYTGQGINVSISEPMNVTTNSAFFEANVETDEEAVLNEKGFIYSLIDDPEIDGSDVIQIAYDATFGTFTIELENLIESQSYYIRAYVITSSNEIIYSGMKNFVTLGDTGEKSVDVQFTEQAPVIDGELDALWSDVPAQVINRAMYGTDEVSFYENAKFKALWDNDYIYILVQVPDDDFYPSEESGEASWLSDKPELYFDVNEIKVDGMGPDNGFGHLQYAPAYNESVDHFIFEYKVDANEERYWVEYAIPFNSLYDMNSIQLDPYDRRTIGFDVVVIDLDEAGMGATSGGMQRVNWSNDGTQDESWSNLDFSGDFNFVGGSTDDTHDDVVVFDPEDYITQVLPEGMSVVSIDGKYYLQVVLNGDDNEIDIPDVTGLMGKELEAEIQYVMGEGSIAKGYDYYNIQHSVEVVDWDNETTYSWEPSDIPLHECWAAFWKEKSDNNMELRYCRVVNPMDNAQTISFYGQVNETWEFTVGDIILCGTIVAKNP